MSANSTVQDETADGQRLSWTTLLAALACYCTSLAVATWPSVLTFATHLPTRVDPVQHLWVMRWYKACLLEGRSPLVCPDIQYPVGAPLANFSPLHLQSLLYLPLSLVIDNDVLCYNLLWMFGFLFTGLATFLLAWHVLKHRAGAIVAGLMAMLSGPMLIHSHAHLELIYVGGFPLFLLAWMQFVDRPSGRRLALALGAFAVLVMCAAYFLVFALFPSGLYVAWVAVQAGRRGDWHWTKRRINWLLAFGASSLPMVLLLFAPQLWNLLQGGLLTRPRAEFDHYGATWWSYLVPSHLHALSHFLPIDLYSTMGQTSEAISYAGIVTIGLAAFGALGRNRVRGMGFWWVLTAMLVVLSFGSTLRVGTWSVTLPSGWLRDGFFAFRLIRVPARFNLFAAVGLAVLAGAGLKRLLVATIPGRTTRGMSVAAVVVLAVADLAHVPYTRELPLEPPECYAWIQAQDPSAAVLAIPHVSSGHPDEQNAACAYWQSLSGLKTSAGYSGHVNSAFDNLVMWNSPFNHAVLGTDLLARHPEPVGIDLIGGAHYLDYAWLYLKTFEFHYVVLPQQPLFETGTSLNLAFLKTILADALVYEDQACAVYDGNRLPIPTQGTIVTLNGWNDRIKLGEHQGAFMSKAAKLAVYNPDVGQHYRLGINARAYARSRTVRLMSGLEELERWEILPDEQQLFVSHPFRLPAGLSTLVFISDGTERIGRLTQTKALSTKAASVFVTGISLAPVPDPDAIVPRIADQTQERHDHDGNR